MNNLPITNKNKWSTEINHTFPQRELLYILSNGTAHRIVKERFRAEGIMITDLDAETFVHATLLGDLLQRYQYYG
jgi:hypothetical protein